VTGFQPGPSPKEVCGITTADAGAVARLHDRGGIPSLGRGRDVSEQLRHGVACRGVAERVERCQQRASQCADETRCLLTVAIERAEDERDDHTTSFACNLTVLGDLLLFSSAQRCECILGRPLHVGCLHRTDEGDVQEEGGAVDDDLDIAPSTRRFYKIEAYSRHRQASKKVPVTLDNEQRTHIDTETVYKRATEVQQFRVLLFQRMIHRVLLFQRMIHRGSGPVSADPRLAWGACAWASSITNMIEYGP